MTRIMLVYVALFLLPFVLFGLWRRFVHGQRGRHEIMSDAPIFILMGLGAALVFGGLFYLSSREQQGVEGQYHPAIIDENGKTIPEHFE